MTNRISLLPDQTSYAATDGANLLSAQNNGNVSIFSRNYINESSTLNVEWIADYDEYNYLAQCYRAYIASGGAPFLISLIFDTDVLVDYLATFVPASFKLSQVSGETYYVTAQLEVKPVPYDVTVNAFYSGAPTSGPVNLATALFNVAAQNISFVSPTGSIIRTAYFSLNVNNVALLNAALTSPSSASFTVTAQNIALNSGNAVSLSSATFVITGEPITLATSGGGGGGGLTSVVLTMP